jgi:hypothetical protein
MSLRYRSIGFFLLAVSPACFAQAGADAALGQQVAELNALVHRLEARVSEIESKLELRSPAPASNTAAAAAMPTAAEPAAPSAVDILRGTTVNIALDGYWGYNFNHPIGRVNPLRAYDVSSNAFSLNQANLILENAPDPAHGKRFGLRLDFQYGQATATLQGSAASEPRPDIYRNVFQA